MSQLKAGYIQLIPIVERATSQTIDQANLGWRGVHGKSRPLYKQEGGLVTERTVPSRKFGEFLNAIFDDWIKRDVGHVYVTTFDVALGSWMGQHNSCVVSPTCGVAPVLEHNGDVYSCDHFVEPDHLLGNLRDTTLSTLLASEKQRRFGNAKFDTLPSTARNALYCSPVTVNAHAIDSSKPPMAKMGSITSAKVIGHSSRISMCR